jgi:hypothetical protein
MPNSSTLLSFSFNTRRPVLRLRSRVSASEDDAAHAARGLRHAAHYAPVAEDPVALRATAAVQGHFTHHTNYAFWSTPRSSSPSGLKR